MLLFIRDCFLWKFILPVDFKTSYVTVYLKKNCDFVFFNQISKHRMLLFIVCRESLEMSIWNFKTSYVTVYPPAERAVLKMSEFQNIVCYCLSISGTSPSAASSISKHRMLLFITISGDMWDKIALFQNIVCYCLSTRSHSIYFTFIISKHRMLLFILYMWHVEAYYTTISKHRMLLFIGSQSKLGADYPDFKTSYVTVYLISLG